MKQTTLVGDSKKMLKIQEQELSAEQQEYVGYNFWDSGDDTVLVACAGSGKTRCMIEKMRYLAQLGKFTKKQMMVFSYSKLTIEHTRLCCGEFQDFMHFCEIKNNIKTIDSFCKHVIDKVCGSSETQSVSVLSSRVAELIDQDPEAIKKKVLAKRCRYGDLKVIFVDEAQDLNETQYKIISFLKQATGSTVHLIGDPNQNIYQFRQSYERYMLNHQGKKFYLTRNFRCDQSIEDFSNYFQYYQHAPREEFKEVADPKITVQLLSHNENDQQVITLVKELKSQGVPLNRIAVVSPTVGDRFQAGIKRIANLLENSGIPYVAFYNEMRDEQSHKATGRQRSQAVNLLTIHGAKGLEFDVVILTKLADKMMYQETYDSQFVITQNMNLIYVALTRARKALYILHDETPSEPGLRRRKHICSILSLIPRDKYRAIGDIQSHLDHIEYKLQQRRRLVDEDVPFTTLTQIGDKKDVLLATKEAIPEFYEMLQKEVMYNVTTAVWKSSVTRMIQQIQQADLLELQRSIVLKKKHEDLYGIDPREEKLFKELRRDHEALVGIVFENVLFYQLQEIKSNRAKQDLMPQTYKIMFTLKDQFYAQVEGKSVFLHLSQFFLLQDEEQMQEVIALHTRARNGEFTQTELDDHLRKLSPQLMEQDYQIYDHKVKLNLAEFLDFDVICNQQLQAIKRAAPFIFGAVKRFNQAFIVEDGVCSVKSWRDQLEDIVYMSMLRAAIKSKHQRYINHDKELIKQLLGFAPLFEKMLPVATDLSQYDVQYQYAVGNTDLIGYIDFYACNAERQESVVFELKAVNETSFDHTLQVLIYDYLMTQQDELYTQHTPRLVVFNALKGIRYEFLIDNREALHQLFDKIIAKSRPCLQYD